jgi:peptide/nickel transport system permease protein
MSDSYRPDTAPRAAAPPNAPARTQQDRYYMASQWRLMARKFGKHRLAVGASIFLALLLAVAALASFIAPYDKTREFADYVDAPPQRIHFVHEGRFGVRPFVYSYRRSLDPVTFRRIYVENKREPNPIRFLVSGYEHRVFGIPSRLHLFGGETGPVFLFGTDKLGRDLFSRTSFALRVTLSVGFLGVVLSFVLGCILGGISGYYGGVADLVIQRVIEIITSIPTIPLWMAMSAALPPDWPSVRVYFSITLILAMWNWTGLARVVRGKLLELREEDFVQAAQLAGGKGFYIIRSHLLPSSLSYLIVSFTLAIPRMILSETSLSFLGLGIRPPDVSLGTLLKEAQNIQSLVVHPWYFVPGIFVIIAVLSFNFVGDGLRDAADPYK